MIWVVSLVAAILLYEAVKYLATLHIRKQVAFFHTFKRTALHLLYLRLSVHNGTSIQ